MNHETVSNEFTMSDPKDLEARNRWRWMLAAALVLSVLCIFLNSPLIFFFFFIITVFISGIYASKSGHSGTVAAVGSIIIPLIWPFILILLPYQQKKSTNTIVLSKLIRVLNPGYSITMEGDQLTIKFLFFRIREMSLADLRLLYVIFPGKFKWRVFSSSQSLQFIPIDLLETDEFNEINELLIEAVKTKKSAGIQLILADYAGNAAQIALTRLGRNPALIEALAHTISRRKEKLDRWLSSAPKVRIQKLLLTPEGIGTEKSPLAWDTIQTLRSETTNGLYSSIDVVLKETKKSRLTGKEKNVIGTLIPSLLPSRKEWYSAELYFWIQKAEMENTKNATA